VTACPGACNAAWRATGEGEPRPGDPAWCPADAARIKLKLAQLDYLAALRNFQVNGHHEQGRDPSHGNGHPPSPSPAADDLDELRSLLYESEDQYRALKGWGPAIRHGYLAPVTTEIIAWLTAHFDGLMASALAEPFGLEVHTLHRRFAAVTRAGTGRRLGVVPCPQCQLRLLAWADGYDGLVCGNCGRHVTRDEYDQDVHATARQLEHAQ
jgi:hypothetical protein